MYTKSRCAASALSQCTVYTCRRLAKRQGGYEHTCTRMLHTQPGAVTQNPRMSPSSRIDKSLICSSQLGGMHALRARQHRSQMPDRSSCTNPHELHATAKNAYTPNSLAPALVAALMVPITPHIHQPCTNRSLPHITVQAVQAAAHIQTACSPQQP